MSCIDHEVSLNCYLRPWDVSRASSSEASTSKFKVMFTVRQFKTVLSRIDMEQRKTSFARQILHLPDREVENRLERFIIEMR